MFSKIWKGIKPMAKEQDEETCTCWQKHSEWKSTELTWIFQWGVEESNKEFKSDNRCLYSFIKHYSFKITWEASRKAFSDMTKKDSKPFVKENKEALLMKTRRVKRRNKGSYILMDTSEVFISTSPDSHFVEFDQEVWQYDGMKLAYHPCNHNWPNHCFMKLRERNSSL